MFIYSVRASTLKLVGVVMAAVGLVFCLAFWMMPSTEGADAVEVLQYSGIRTEEDRRAFLAECGWQTAPEAVETADFTVPADFDRVLAGYNQLQKQQGLDLSRYAGKTVTRYTYRVTNYPDYEGTVYANLILYRNRVVAGDVCSADPGGFVVVLEKGH